MNNQFATAGAAPEAYEAGRCGGIVPRVRIIGKSPGVMMIALLPLCVRWPGNLITAAAVSRQQR